MKNEQIGKILKKYRKMNMLSVSDVVVELSEKYQVNVAEKTIYGWESNQAHPTAPMLIALCDIYKINNITEIFPKNQNQKAFPLHRRNAIWSNVTARTKTYSLLSVEF